MKIILRQVFIYKDDGLIYKMQFGKALTNEDFDNLYHKIKKDAYAVLGDRVQYYDYYKYRISYITSKELNLIFFFVTGLTDSFKDIKTELYRCKNEFLNLFEGVLDHHFDAKTFEVFDPTINIIHKNLRPKISLIGFSGVGKTTITKLIRAEEIPMEHVPTITGDIATIKIGNLHFHLWDFAGQEQFSYLWNNFVKGSDAVLLITDSYLENVEKSKYFLDLIKDEAPDAHTAIIGNKQDLGDRLPVVEIEKILGLKTYSMIANRSENRDKMITIIADILEMSAEVSPLLKPLIERDRSMVEAESALNSGDLQNALTLFEKIADLSIDLGDDSLGKEFHEKAEKIREIVKKMETTQVEIVKTPEVAEEEATEPVTPPAPPPASPTEPPKPPEAGPVAPPAPPPAVPTKPPKPPVAVPVAPPASPVGIPAEPDRPTSSPPTLEPPEDTPKITINLADFKIKKRPTNILAAKPTGPKATLKTTPFGHVKPQSLPISPPPTSAAPTPTPAPKPVPKSPPSELISPVVAEAPTGDKILTQKSEIEKSLMDLKIKLASISKMELDLEMKEISGDITSEEFEEKKNKMAKLKGNISKQIQELENLLSNF